MRQHVQHGGVVEGLQTRNLDAHGGVVLALTDDAGGNLGHVEEGQVGDDTGGEGPRGELGGCAQADAAPREIGLESQAESAQGDEEYERLHNHAEGRGTGEHEGLCVGPVVYGVDWVGVGGLRSEEEDEEEQRQDGDDVVQHGRPHVRAEGVLRVEHLPNDGVEAVEEDLG